MPIKTEPLPTAELLHEKFRYDPDSGIVYWRPRPPQDFTTYNAYRTWNSRFANQPAGWTLKGGKGKLYIALTLDYRKFLAHRAIWKMMTGKEPIEEIDHEDGNGLNKAWYNLREATRPEQMQNKSVRSDNILGIKNVRKLPGGRYQAYIRRDGKMKALGTYATPEEAYEAYEEAAKIYHGDFRYRDT